MEYGKDQYITAQKVSIGKLIEPLKRVYLFSADEYEEYIAEWLDLKKTEYFFTERLGGAGDMGRDIVAYYEDPHLNPSTYKWDCFQCKHYDTPLAPSVIWEEIGKIIYYSFIKEFPVPNKYFFVPSKGIGTSLVNLLNNPQKLKTQLHDNWDAKCKKEITKTQDITLEGDFLRYFNSFDFGIFGKLDPKIILEQHSKHQNHLLRFGGGLPDRKKVESIPEKLLDNELRYIKQLLLAYNTSTNTVPVDIALLHGVYLQHFKRARESFYNAEELRNFTRDNLPMQVYIDFQENILNGVINTVEGEYENGFIKVKTVEDAAVKITVESNPLREVCNTIDKKGVCHQLVNDGRISWVDINE